MWCIAQKEIVFERKLACEDPEKLYYSAKFEDIRIHCSGAVDPWSDTEPFYAQCKACNDKLEGPYSLLGMLAKYSKSWKQNEV